MKHLDEYRSRARVERHLEQRRATRTPPWRIMEVCGGQTHSIVRFGLDTLLPAPIELLHGPGCPVCVTPAELIDRAIELAARPEVTLCSFGDMLRVAGTESDLADARARGGDVRVVYSPLDALRLAEREPERQVVFFAVGFETTAPSSALCVSAAQQGGVGNFSLLCSHVRVPPALERILEQGRVDGLLAAGHVCAVTGLSEYEPLARTYGVPIVVTGFEPVDLLRGVLRCVQRLERGDPAVENAYRRVVQEGGNPHALAEMARVFRVVPRSFRGIGPIEGGGLALREEYEAFDAERRFPAAPRRAAAPAPSRCQAGPVLLGLIKPPECPEFGRRCTPQSPLGAPMVSSEGACAAYHQHRDRPAAALASAPERA